MPDTQSVDRSLVTSPEQLDTLVRSIDSKAWLLWAFLSLFIVSGLIWGLLGTVTSRLPVEGVVFGNQTSAIDLLAPEDAVLKEWLVDQSSELERGEPVARLEFPALKNRLLGIERELIEATRRGNAAEIAQLQAEEFSLERQLDQMRTVTVAKPAYLVAHLVSEGEKLEKGKPIARVRTGEGKAPLLTAFIGPEHLVHVSPNMPVHFRIPTISNDGQTMLVQGRIQEISELPASRDDMQSLLGNERLVDYFQKMQLPYAIQVELSSKATFVERYKWRMRDGRNEAVMLGGIPVEGSIVIGKRSPISLLFPFL